MEAGILKSLQAAAGLTNKQLAKLLTKSEVTIEKWRSGERGISEAMTQLINKILGPRIKKNLKAMAKLVK